MYVICKLGRGQIWKMKKHTKTDKRLHIIVIYIYTYRKYRRVNTETAFVADEKSRSIRWSIPHFFQCQYSNTNVLKLVETCSDHRSKEAGGKKETCSRPWVYVKHIDK